MILTRVVFAVIAFAISCGSVNANPLLEINVGASPNDGTGDPLRLAFQKIMAAVNKTGTLVGDVWQPLIPSGYIGPAYLQTGAAVANIGTLGGALTGTLPSPSIMPGYITDSMISGSAAIDASKLSFTDTLAFYEPGFAFNEKRWKFEIQPGSFYGKKVSDDQLTELNWLQVNGNGVASIPDIFLNGFTVVPKFKVSASSEQNVATFERTSAPTDQKRWRLQQTDTDFALHAVNDADSAPVASITASRSSGTTLGNLVFGHPNTYQIAAGAAISYQFRKTDAPADQKRWSLNTTDTQWKLTAINDSNSVANDALTITRSGAAVSNVTLATNTDINGNLTLGSQAGVSLHNDSAGADAKSWNEIIDGSGTYLLRTRTDAGGGGANGLSITRSGTAISVLTIGGAAKLKNFTVGTLPTCNSTYEGSIAYVTDAAAAPVYNATVAGGGSTKIQVFCDGTNWKNS